MDPSNLRYSRVRLFCPSYSVLFFFCPVIHGGGVSRLIEKNIDGDMNEDDSEEDSEISKEKLVVESSESVDEGEVFGKSVDGSEEEEENIELNKELTIQWRVFGALDANDGRSKEYTFKPLRTYNDRVQSEINFFTLAEKFLDHKESKIQF